MTSAKLFEITAEALAITGQPEWASPEVPDDRDALVYLSDDAGEPEVDWALAPVGSGEADYVPIDSTMAEELIKAHLRSWLLDRGWQVQVVVRKQSHAWRLVDCLSIADGGGDRLDRDYPFGDDELVVQCMSVAAVETT